LSAELRVRVVPRAARSRIQVLEGDVVKVWLTAAPTDGQANEQLIVVLAEALGIRRSQVSIRSGHSHRSKQIELFGVDAEEALARLSAYG